MAYNIDELFLDRSDRSLWRIVWYLRSTTSALKDPVLRSADNLRCVIVDERDLGGAGRFSKISRERLMIAGYSYSVGLSTRVSGKTVAALQQYLENFANGPFVFAWENGSVNVRIQDPKDEAMIRSVFPNCWAQPRRAQPFA